MFTDADDGKMCGSRVCRWKIAGLSATVAFSSGAIPPRLKVASNEKSTRRPKCWECLALHRFSKPVIIDYSTQ